MDRFVWANSEDTDKAAPKEGCVHVSAKLFVGMFVLICGL